MNSIHKSCLGGLLGCTLVFAPAAQAEFLDCLHLEGFDPVPAAWRGNLQLHNCARKTAVPRPQPALKKLRWDAALAQTAQSWASQCNWQHSGVPGLGENLYARAPWGAAHTAAAQSWAAEFADYNHAGNSCAPQRQCGHYTHMVWRSTESIGCAIKNCSTGSPFVGFPQWTIVVCNYDPPGNYQGMKPY